MNIFEFKDYRDFFRNCLRAKSLEGRGQINKFSEFIKVHPSLTSQVLRGHRDFTLEQGIKACHYLGLSELETEFILNLIGLNRAGDRELKGYYQRKLQEIRERSGELQSRLKDHRVLTDSQRTLFYSSWLFSAIRLFTSIGDGKSIEDVSEKFHLGRVEAIQILQFLLETGLCVKIDEKYRLGTQRTHVEFGSPHLARHHINWRLRGLEKIDRIKSREFMFTAPFSISKKDFARLRDQLVEFASERSKEIADSPAEMIGCFNMDLFTIDDEFG